MLYPLPDSKFIIKNKVIFNLRLYKLEHVLKIFHTSLVALRSIIDAQRSTNITIIKIPIITHNATIAAMVKTINQLNYWIFCSLVKFKYSYHVQFPVNQDQGPLSFGPQLLPLQIMRDILINLTMREGHRKIPINLQTSYQLPPIK